MKDYNKIALQELEIYLNLPQELKEQYVPIYSPKALKFMYFTNPTEVFEIVDLAIGEDKKFLNIGKIIENFLDKDR